LLAPEHGRSDTFPRSATMRLLLNGSGGRVGGAALAALVMGRAPLIAGLLRLIPVAGLMRGLFRRG
jgi:hypothetical protein